MANKHNPPAEVHVPRNELFIKSQIDICKSNTDSNKLKTNV